MNKNEIIKLANSLGSNAALMHYGLVKESNILKTIGQGALSAGKWLGGQAKTFGRGVAKSTDALGDMMRVAGQSGGGKGMLQGLKNIGSGSVPGVRDAMATGARNLSFGARQALPGALALGGTGAATYGASKMLSQPKPSTFQNLQQYMPRMY